MTRFQRLRIRRNRYPARWAGPLHFAPLELD